jgi:beta-glucosidase-like glycosyl hydrolase/CubicO group peptidase (beta-lactamase class C family)
MLRFLSRRTILGALAALLIVAVGLVYFTGGAAPVSARAAPSAAMWPGAGAWATSVLDTLTLKEKVSQLFSARAYGRFRSVDDPRYERLKKLAEDFGIGGFAFFQGHPMEQATLVNDLQESSDLPLLVSQDMEWGAGMRIEQTTTFPRAMALGATRDADLARAVGYATAHEARALGTQQVYAPVADVNNNPRNPIINVRSYGEKPGLVAEMTAASVNGIQRGGAISTVKHFPGHGDTSTDSHVGLPVLTFGMERLQNLELVPFRAALDAGVKSVMVGHLAFPAMEPDSSLPATLSPNVTRDLLREQMSYDGLIVTDGLDMRGVTDQFGAGEIAVRALEAGTDVLLLSTDPYAARKAILKAIESGRLTEERIDESVMRILRAKEWAGLHEDRLADLDQARKQVATRPHQALSRTIARRGLTLLRNERDLLPLTAGRSRSVMSVVLNDGDWAEAGQSFQRALARQARNLTTHLLDARSDSSDYQAVLDEAAGQDLVVVPAYLPVRTWSGSISLSEEHETFLNDLIATGTPVILVSFGNPYMVMGLDRPAAYIAAYGSDRATQTAAAGALYGASGFGGALPISIPNRYDFGAGLSTDQIAPRHGHAEAVGMSSDRLRRIDSLMQRSIRREAFPGAAVAVGRAGVIAKQEGYGHFTYEGVQPVTDHSPFDLASLTKVVATTTAAMLLTEQGKLALDDRVASYLPEFGQKGKDQITIRQLLSHSAGLEGYRAYHQMDESMHSREAIIDSIMAEPLKYEPGTQSEYSDLGIITLYLMIEEITGEPFEDWTEQHIFEPLRMDDTGFRPALETDTTVVPTERDKYFRERLIQGEVHDETAWLLGGVSGHAGLFSTADDLAHFAYMLANEGNIYGKNFLDAGTIEEFTTPVQGTRALGWDTKSPEGYSTAGDLFSNQSFGHTGFTGTSLWIDPEADLFAILLTNRVYPTRKNEKIDEVRPAFADAAHRAVMGPPELYFPMPEGLRPAAPDS